MSLVGIVFSHDPEHLLTTPATLRNYAAASKIYNLDIVNTNSSGPQALALSAAGTQQGYYGCGFIGHDRTSKEAPSEI